MKKALENLFKFFSVGIPSVVLSAALLAVSLLCLASGCLTSAMLFGITLLCPTFMVRSQVDSEALDLAIAALVVYLVLINHCLTIYNCSLISFSVGMAFLLPGLAKQMIKLSPPHCSIIVDME